MSNALEYTDDTLERLDGKLSQLDELVAEQAEVVMEKRNTWNIAVAKVAEEKGDPQKSSLEDLAEASVELSGEEEKLEKLNKQRDGVKAAIKETEKWQGQLITAKEKSDKEQEEREKKREEEDEDKDEDEDEDEPTPVDPDDDDGTDGMGAIGHDPEMCEHWGVSCLLPSPPLPDLGGDIDPPKDEVSESDLCDDKDGQEQDEPIEKTTGCDPEFCDPATPDDGNDSTPVVTNPIPLAPTPCPVDNCDPHFLDLGGAGVIKPIEYEPFPAGRNPGLPLGGDVYGPIKNPNGNKSGGASAGGSLGSSGGKNFIGTSQPMPMP